MDTVWIPHLNGQNELTCEKSAKTSTHSLPMRSVTSRRINRMDQMVSRHNCPLWNSIQPRKRERLLCPSIYILSLWNGQVGKTSERKCDSTMLKKYAWKNKDQHGKEEKGKYEIPSDIRNSKKAIENKRVNSRNEVLQIDLKMNGRSEFGGSTWKVTATKGKAGQSR